MPRIKGSSCASIGASIGASTAASATEPAVTAPLTTDQLALLRARLEQRLAALLRDAAPAVDVADAPAPETSPLDRATVRLLGDLTREAADHHATELRQVRRALDRCADGSYGSCEECGLAIGASRLLARPEARLCIVCQTRAERR